jgi:hypothetical protein
LQRFKDENLFKSILPWHGDDVYFQPAHGQRQSSSVGLQLIRGCIQAAGLVWTKNVHIRNLGMSTGVCSSIHSSVVRKKRACLAADIDISFYNICGEKIQIPVAKIIISK